MFRAVSFGGVVARRGVRLARPLSLIGVGCVGQYAYSRDESVPQLAVGSAATCWSKLMATAELLHEQHAQESSVAEQVASSELRVLVDSVAKCAAAGLDSALIRLAVLRRLRDVVAADARGAAVLGLVQDELDFTEDVQVRGCASHATRARRELIALIDDTATSLALGAHNTSMGGAYEAEACAYLIQILSVVTAGNSAWHKELGSDGVVRVAHCAALASRWLGEERRRTEISFSSRSNTNCELPDAHDAMEATGPAAADSPASETVCPPTNEEKLIEIWRRLGHKGVLTEALGSLASPQPEAAARREELLASLAALSTMPAPPPQAAGLPVREFLSETLQNSITDAKGDGEVPSSNTSMLRRLIKLSLLVTVAGSAIVVVSQDGLGYCDFRAVPESWRPALESLITTLRASASGAGSPSTELSRDRTLSSDSGCASASTRQVPMQQKFQDFMHSFRQRT